MERDKLVDAAKGVLIVCVVLGHMGVAGDIICLFHMPLFFAVSGYLLAGKRLEKGYVVKIGRRVLIPYVAYMLIDVFLVRRELNWKGLVKALWGGRLINGVYWYATAYVFAILLLWLIASRIPLRWQKPLILFGGGVAVMESNVIHSFYERNMIVGLLYSPGIPLNLDVALMALVYIAAGYYQKGRIDVLFHGESRKLDLMAALSLFLFALFCIFNSYGVGFHLDMKHAEYREMALVLLLPGMAGTVLARSVRALGNHKATACIVSVFSVLGQVTLPIMFLHIPLNSILNPEGKSGLGYLLIGIGLPVLLSLFLGNTAFMRKVFGLPRLWPWKDKASR